MTDVEAGPVRLVQVVAEAWALTDGELASLLGEEGADRQDGARLIFLIHSTLADLFLDAGQERKWMRSPLVLLDGETPLQVMLVGGISGMRVVREIVERRLANRR